MTIRATFTASLIACVAIACSSQPREMVSAAPTAPTATLPLITTPARSDTVDFRRQLESKYAGMGRQATQVYVDQEGDAAWIGEYHRYRVNGCDHNIATQRALEQIDGVAASPVCSVLQFPETAQYPPRDQLVDFRRQLGAKYQAMGRSAQSSVDPDGSGIWVGEYLRYRSSTCDHPSSVQNTLTQIDGRPAPPTCIQECSYTFSQPSATVSSTGGTFSMQMIRTSGTCDWVAQSEVPWITINRPPVGTDRSFMTYTVAENTETFPRDGTIRISYPAEYGRFPVHQRPAGSNMVFELFDVAISSTVPSLECQIRSTGTVCTLTARDGDRPAPPATYDWRVEYTYNGVKVRTQTGALPTFSFTETCSAGAGTGQLVPIKVRLIVSGSQGHSGTLMSGEGTQPALQLRAFACPSS